MSSLTVQFNKNKFQKPLYALLKIRNDIKNV
jgi:hypothetical protein